MFSGGPQPQYNILFVENVLAFYIFHFLTIKRQYLMQQLFLSLSLVHGINLDENA